MNDKNFFCNITLARFNKATSRLFKEKVMELSSTLSFEPYLIDEASLIATNAVSHNPRIITTWQLI